MLLRRPAHEVKERRRISLRPENERLARRDKRDRSEELISGWGERVRQTTFRHIANDTDDPNHLSPERRVDSPADRILTCKIPFGQRLVDDDEASELSEAAATSSGASNVRPATTGIPIVAK